MLWKLVNSVGVDWSFLSIPVVESLSIFFLVPHRFLPLYSCYILPDPSLKKRDMWMIPKMHSILLKILPKC